MYLSLYIYIYIYICLHMQIPYKKRFISDICVYMCICICKYIGKYIFWMYCSIYVLYMSLLTALKPAQCSFVFLLLDYFRVGVGWGGYQRPWSSSFTTCVLIVFSTSLHTLHVTLDTSCLLRCTHFMLRWIRLVYFVAHTSCYVASSQPKRWASWHEGKTTAGAAVWSHTSEHDDGENVTIVYRNSIGIYEKCVLYCSGN